MWLLTGIRYQKSNPFQLYLPRKSNESAFKVGFSIVNIVQSFNFSCLYFKSIINVLTLPFQVFLPKLPIEQSFSTTPLE